MKPRLSRREFLAATAAATSAKAAPSRGVSLIVDPGSSHWAIGELESALVAHNVAVQRCDRLRQAQPGNVRVLTRSSFHAVIPSGYTNTQYPIEYYFEVRTAEGKAGLYPGFLPNRPGQPCFVVRRA